MSDQNNTNQDDLKKAAVAAEMLENMARSAIDAHDNLGIGWKAPSQSFNPSNSNHSNNSSSSRNEDSTGNSNNSTGNTGSSGGSGGSGGTGSHGDAGSSGNPNVGGNTSAGSFGGGASFGGGTSNSSPIENAKSNWSGWEQKSFAGGNEKKNNFQNSSGNKDFETPQFSSNVNASSRDKKWSTNIEDPKVNKPNAAGHVVGVTVGSQNNIKNGMVQKAKADNLADFQGNIGKTNKEEKLQVGYYNTMKKANTESLRQTVAKTIANATTEESDAAQGYQEIKHRADLLGVGGFTKQEAKYEIEQSLHKHKYKREKDRLDAEKLKAVIDKDYVASSREGTNVLKDYRYNRNKVESYLENRGINAKNLDRREIERAIKTKELKSYMHHGGNIKLDDQAIMALKELHNLQKTETLIKKYKNAGGGVNNVTKAWVSESFKDSDASSGYQTVKTGYKVAKGAGWVAKGTAGAAADVAIGTTALAGKTILKAGRGVAVAGSKFSTSPITKERWELANKGMQSASKKVTVVTDKARDKVHGFVKTSATDKLKAKVGKTKTANAISGFVKKRMEKMNGVKKVFSKVGKVVFAPFKLFNVGKALIRKIMIYLGGVILAIAVTDLFILVVASIIPDIGQWELEPFVNSAAQKTVNQLFVYQQAYEHNIYQAKAGDDYIGYGIPNSWKNKMRNCDSSGALEDSMTAVYDGSTLKGYNLNHYWGPYVDYSATCSENVCHVKGPGGLGVYSSGDMGEYSSLNNTIDHGSPAYRELKNVKNPDVTVNFNYMGSKKSFQWTASKGSTYTTRDGTVCDYDIDTLYKGILATAIGKTDNNDECAEFLLDYTKPLFDSIMDNATLTLTTKYESTDRKVHWIYHDPQYGDFNCEADAVKPIVTLDIFLNDCGLQDIIKYDTFADNSWLHSTGRNHANSIAHMNCVYKVRNERNKRYLRWMEGAQAGWDAHTLTEEMKTPRELALTYYDLGIDDWEALFEGLTFPGSLSDGMSDEEIERAIDESGATGERKDLVEFALSCVGKFKYKYGGGHPLKNPNMSPDEIAVEVGGLDCSGFVSYALYKSGVDLFYNSRGAVSFAREAFDRGSLQPGTILVKNKTAGTASGSSNHVVIYCGTITPPGESSPRPCFVECTSVATNYKGIKITGPQVSSKSRTNFILRTYKYMYNI